MKFERIPTPEDLAVFNDFLDYMDKYNGFDSHQNAMLVSGLIQYGIRLCLLKSETRQQATDFIFDCVNAGLAE